MNILVTGGAGFIGSNIVKALLEHQNVKFVRVLDNLSSGFERNLEEFVGHPKFDFVNGDIRDYKICLSACEGIDRISHQAALGSVPRSIKDPLTTNEVNITGTLNVYNAARICKIKRIVYAASSSTYGDSKGLPKVEDVIGKPLSPYAVTKYVMELYAKVFNDLYDIDFVGLRYFNVFGPKQDPGGAYAAVIPLFFKNALENTNPTINGDGTFTRDFTYIANVVQANILALEIENPLALNQVYNIACGKQTDLNTLWELIKEITNSKSSVIHGPARIGDIPHSLANIDKANSLLGYIANFDVQEGLKNTKNWYKQV